MNKKSKTKNQVIPEGVDWDDKKEALLQEQEEIIENGRAAFDKTLKALATIHHEKLYLKTHTNFGTYCEERFGFGQRWAERIISLVGLNAKLELLANSSSHPELRTGAKLIRESAISAREIIKDLPTKRLKTVAKAIGKTGEIPTAKKLKETIIPDEDEDEEPKCAKCGKKLSGNTADYIDDKVCVCDNREEPKPIKLPEVRPLRIPTPLDNHPVLIALDNEWVNIQRGLAYGNFTPIQIYQKLRAAAEKAIVTK